MEFDYQYWTKVMPVGVDEREALTNNSGSSGGSETILGNEYDERRLSLQSFAALATSHDSTPVSFESTAVSENHDGVRILTAEEAAEEKAAALRRAPDELYASRKRKRQMMETKAKPTECTICCEDCTIVGKHRLVALKCGHLFGKKCIKRWVREKHTCPNCSAFTLQTDICLLFSDRVAVVDNSGLVDMTQKFQKEKEKNRKLELELAFVRLQLWKKEQRVEQLNTDLTKCKKAFAEMRSSTEQQRRWEVLNGRNSQTVAVASDIDPLMPCRQPHQSPIICNLFEDQRCHSQPHAVSESQLMLKDGNTSSIATLRKYKLMCAVPLFGARVFSIARSCRLVCVGDKLSQDSHGLLILSCQDPTRGCRLPIHSSEVRDVCINSSESLVLTVAFDGRMAMTSLHDKTVTLQMMLPTGRRQGWSCTFSESDPYAMYCGFQDGSVAKYDYRKPTAGEQGIVESFSLPERQPVHSIKLFQSSEGMEGLAAATFRGLSIWKNVGTNWSVGANLVRATPFTHVPSDQPCFSLASNQLHSHQVVLSARSTPLKHSVFDLRSIEIERLLPKVEFAGHKASSVLSRSAVWSEPNGALLVASWSHDVKSVTLWDVATHREVSGPELATLNVANPAMPVVDIQHAVARNCWSSGTALLGTMTSRQLCVYRLGA